MPEAPGSTRTGRTVGHTGWQTTWPWLVALAIGGAGCDPAVLDQGGAAEPAATVQVTAAPDRSPTPAADEAAPASLAEQVREAAIRGAGFLGHTQRSDGRFVSAYLPSLNKVVATQQSIIRQAACAIALGDLSRYARDGRLARAANRAIVRLIENTKTRTPRKTGIPERLAVRSFPDHPLGATATLCLAELSQPDVRVRLDRIELYVNYLLGLQSDEGWFHASTRKDRPGSQEYYPGKAMVALLRSHRHRPRQSILRAIEAAYPYYRRYFVKDRSTGFFRWHAQAFAEAYLITRREDYADFVLTMADWICTLQYRTGDKSQERPTEEVPSAWVGGFRTYIGKYKQTVDYAPTLGTAAHADGLVHAWRVAHALGDRERADKYRKALDDAMRFLLRLQYTPEKLKHFGPRIQRRLLGAFHPGLLDGHIRNDYTAKAVIAMVGYLGEVLGQAPRDPAPLRSRPKQSQP